MKTKNYGESIGQKTLNKWKVKQGFEEFKSEIVCESVTTMFYISMIVMRDKYGFGKKRLGDFVEYLVDQLKLLQDEYVTIEDMANAIYEETGVKIYTKEEDDNHNKI